MYEVMVLSPSISLYPIIKMFSQNCVVILTKPKPKCCYYMLQLLLLGRRRCRCRWLHFIIISYENSFSSSLHVVKPFLEKKIILDSGLQQLLCMSRNFFLFFASLFLENENTFLLLVICYKHVTEHNGTRKNT